MGARDPLLPVPQRERVLSRVRRLFDLQRRNLDLAGDGAATQRRDIVVRGEHGQRVAEREHVLVARRLDAFDVHRVWV